MNEKEIDDKKELEKDHAYVLTIKAFLKPPRGIHDLSAFRGWIFGYLKAKDIIFDLENIVLEHQNDFFEKKDVANKECDCEEWKVCMDELDDMFLKSYGHYDKKLFDYCPWCGNVLK